MGKISEDRFPIFDFSSVDPPVHSGCRNSSYLATLFATQIVALQQFDYNFKATITSRITKVLFNILYTIQYHQMLYTAYIM